jgi:hypothetical protein
MSKYEDLLNAVRRFAPKPQYVQARMPEPVTMRAPPPPSQPPARNMGFYGSDPGVVERYEEFLRRAAADTPPAEDMTRLYRVGETATQYQPPKTVRMFGQDIPYEQFVAMKEAGEGFNPNPKGAAGRWATDAPHELDFYIGDNSLTAPIYRFDVPSSEVAQYNVANTPFLKNSRNATREFVLPDEYLERAVRLLSPMLPIAAGASAGRDR